MPCGSDNDPRIIWSACLGSMPSEKISSTDWSNLVGANCLSSVDGLLERLRLGDGLLGGFLVAFGSAYDDWHDGVRSFQWLLHLFTARGPALNQASGGV
jgi:hypothetical protein